MCLSQQFFCFSFNWSLRFAMEETASARDDEKVVCRLCASAFKSRHCAMYTYKINKYIIYMDIVVNDDDDTRWQFVSKKKKCKNSCFGMLARVCGRRELVRRTAGKSNVTIFVCLENIVELKSYIFIVFINLLILNWKILRSTKNLRICIKFCHKSLEIKTPLNLGP